MGVQADDDLSKSVQKTPHRVDLNYLLSRIVNEEYLHPDCLPTMTICVMEIENGFVLVGHSAPADPDNFDPKVGETFAHENAIRQLWQLEGYLLREKLHAQRE